MKIDAKTKQLGIIGCPVEHSFSPKMHNFISEKLGKPYVYSAWRVEPDNLGAAIAGIRALGIRGINVTAPYKKEVMQYLDEISPQAKLLGSVNTIVNRGGRLYGYNTDAEGFYKALLNAGITLGGKRILILGAGGVVKPTLMRIIQEDPASITLLNRTAMKADVLALEMRSKMGFEVNTSLKDIDFDIVINTTSAGMDPQLDALPIDAIAGLDNLDFINDKMSVVDMIYNPSETLFLKEAKKRGAKTLNGLGMLIQQGLTAYELFTDSRLPAEIEQMVVSEVFGL